MADLEVIGEAGDGLELLKLLEKITPHMILLDISMPNLRGNEALREIKALHPEVKILILSMHKEKEYLYQAISAGANGYFLKEDADTELSTAIETIRRGKIYISPLLSGDVADDWAQTYRGKSKLPYEPDNLTTRERGVLKMIAEGKSSKTIADLLFISVCTVERHRANLMDKLSLKKTANLVKYAIHKGYL
jgi:DNA-binding NarL/FixJ family response regulator